MSTAYTCGTIAQPKATTMVGATSLVTAAPVLPTPKMPMASPWRSRGNQRAQ